MYATGCAYTARSTDLLLASSCTLDLLVDVSVQFNTAVLVVSRDTYVHCSRSTRSIFTRSSVRLTAERVDALLDLLDSS